MFTTEQTNLEQSMPAVILADWKRPTLTKLSLSETLAPLKSGSAMDGFGTFT